MKIKTLLFFLLLFLFNTTYIIAQTNRSCTSSIETFTAIRGLKLNMTSSQVREIYPNILMVEKDGTGIGVIEQDQISNTEYKNGIKKVGVLLVEGKVFTFNVEYDKSITWNSLREFSTKISESLSLPSTGWRGTDSLILECSNFVVSVSYTKEKTINLFITKPPNELSKDNDKKKESFKP